MRSPGLRLGLLIVLGIVASACGGVSATDSAALEESAAGARVAAGAVDVASDSDNDAMETTGTTVPVRPEVNIPETWPSDVDELFGRYWLYWEAFAAAHALPYADPSFEQLRLLSTEENWQSLQEQLQGFAQDRLVLVLPPNSVTEHLIRLPNASPLEKAEGAEVMIQDCWIDDFVQQTLDGAVVASTKEAKLMNVNMKVVDGQWRVDGVARATTESDGYEQCATLV